MIQKGDFLEIDFVGRVKITNQIFDLTVKDIAKKEGIYQEKHKYKPLEVVIGQGFLLEGLEEALVGKKVGDEFELDIPAEKAFGTRNPKLMQLTNLTMLKKKGVNPVPGMQLNVDGAMATVRSVSGGRVILDFNHPLSGKTLHYWIKINKKLEKTEEKLKAIISVFLNLEPAQYELELKEGKANLDIKEPMPEPVLEVVKEKAKELLPDLTELSIKTSKPKEAKQK